MSIIRTDYKNLLGGVSQQPNSVRLDNQCEIQDNAQISVVDGLGKRQPTEHVKSLWDAGLSGSAFIHWINRDSTERYVVLSDKDFDAANPLQIYDLATGTKMALTLQGDLYTRQRIHYYLRATTTTLPKGTKDTHDSNRDLRAVTVADTTFILNRTVTTLIDESVITDALNVANHPNEPPSLRSKSSRRHFLFQRTANPLNKYAVRVHTKTGKFNPIYPKDTWDPPLDDKLKIQAAHWHEFATGWVKCFDLDYLNMQRPRGKGWGGSESVPRYEPDKPPTPSGQFSGYCIPTIQTNEVLKRLWTETYEGFGIPAKPPYNSHGGTALYHGGIQSAYNLVRQHVSTIGILLIPEKIISDRGKPQQISELPLKNGVMKLELVPTQKLINRDYIEEMIVQVVERGDVDDSLVAFSDTIDRVSQLPLTCEHGHIVKIVGLEDNDNDEFYAEFVTDDIDEVKPFPSRSHNMGQGHWKEGLASLSNPHIDNSTMPLKLTRVNDASMPLGFRFNLEMIDWEDKLVGDDNSNPDPSFIGKEIEDMFLWRNRLGFLSGSRFIMSEADEYENFWRTSVKQLLDSDPIDLDAGHNDVANLNFATPFEDELVVWTDRTQFIAQGNPLLTPTSATIVPTTNYENYKSVRPIATERGVFFAYQSGGGKYSQVDFYQRLGDVADSFDAFKSSGQIPRYIEGVVKEMTATSLQSTLVVRADTNDHILYVHKWLDSGSDRVLSAWMRYIIGPSTKTKIHGMSFIEDILYMIVERRSYVGSTSVNLEKMTFSGSRQVDSGSGTTESAFRCSLDRRLDETSVTTVVYNATTETVDIELPYHVQDTDVTTSTLVEMKIVSRPDTSTGLEGEIFDFTHTTKDDSEGNKVSLLSIADPKQLISISGFKFWIGMSYTMIYEFSEPALRDRQQGRGATEIKTGRFQILRGVLSFEDSGYFTVTVTPKLHSDGSKVSDRDDIVYTMPMLEVGLGRSKLGSANVRDGTVKFGIYSAPQLVRLIVENDSPFPSNPKTLELLSEYTRRSRLTTF